MENDGDTKKTVKEWLVFLNSNKQTFMAGMARDDHILIVSGTLLIGWIVSIAEGVTHWALGVLGILLILFFMRFVGIRGRYKLLLIFGIINIQHEILKGELKEVKDISKKYFSLVPKEK